MTKDTTKFTEVVDAYMAAITEETTTAKEYNEVLTEWSAKLDAARAKAWRAKLEYEKVKIVELGYL